MTHRFLKEHFKDASFSESEIVNAGLHKVAMITSTLFQIFSTIVTAVVTPHAKEVNYSESVHTEFSVKIMNLIDSRNIYLLLYSKCQI